MWPTMAAAFTSVASFAPTQGHPLERPGSGLWSGISDRAALHRTTDTPSISRPPKQHGNAAGVGRRADQLAARAELLGPCFRPYTCAWSLRMFIGLPPTAPSPWPEILR